MRPSVFFTHSQRDPRVARILAAALQAVDPAQVVERYLASTPLPAAKRIFALGLGKAALPMARALARQVCLTRALLITKHASPPGFETATVIESGHPLPDDRSLAAGRAALDFVSGLRSDDLLICLISGGGSALVTAPAVSLDHMQKLTSALLACGARINEINTLRRHLDAVKGAGIARQTQATVLSLILSDVVASPLEAIASGPTAPDPSTREQALSVLSKYQLEEKLPQSITRALRENPETPKPGDSIFSRVENVIVGDNTLAVQAALRQAQREGFETENLGSHWQGEARQVGLKLANRLRVANKVDQPPLCLIAGGETTVTICGDGLGGRNQELALAAVPRLAGLEHTILISLATDGEDGPTDAAGAVVSSETLQRAESRGLVVEDYLARNDAYHFFQELDDLIEIGPTGTNINDLTFLFILS